MSIDLARDTWLERARVLSPERAVHPDTRWLAYDLWTRRMLQRWTLRRLRADRPRFRRVVDLGCGFGDWTVRLGALSDELHACELAPELAAEAQRRLAGHRAARVECADIRDWEVPRGLDLAYLGGVLMYLSDREATDVVRRVRAAAAPGALVVIRDFCAFGRGRRSEDARTGTIYRRVSELVAIAQRVGLCVERVRSSPSIYGEVMGGPVLGWPLRAVWRVATLHWARASHTVIARAIGC
ncbi:MAG TPA: class I SAM-dependent methyltransferase [Kofleriaceae bacterium]|nr:class I SAM-dependent methyltransferase [Kofleriaceae bacterium]